nr:hypothetical protein [Angustibacter aerolatus]
MHGGAAAGDDGLTPRRAAPGPAGRARQHVGLGQQPSPARPGRRDARRPGRSGLRRGGAHGRRRARGPSGPHPRPHRGPAHRRRRGLRDAARPPAARRRPRHPLRLHPRGDVADGRAHRPRRAVPDASAFAWAVLEALVDSLGSGSDVTEGEPTTWVRLAVRGGTGSWG